MTTTKSKSINICMILVQKCSAHLLNKNSSYSKFHPNWFHTDITKTHEAHLHRYANGFMVKISNLDSRNFKS